MINATDTAAADKVELYYLANMPHGRRWTWMNVELLVIEANLDEAGREAAIREAFDDLRERFTRPK